MTPGDEIMAEMQAAEAAVERVKVVGEWLFYVIIGLAICVVVEAERVFGKRK